MTDADPLPSDLPEARHPGLGVAEEVRRLGIEAHQAPKPRYGTPLEHLFSLIGLVDDIGLGQGQSEVTLSDGLNVVNRSVGRHDRDVQSWVGVAYDLSDSFASREIDSRETAGPDQRSPSLHQVLPQNDPAQGEADNQESPHTSTPYQTVG